MSNIFVRLPDVEKKDAERKAKDLGVSLSEFVRIAVRGIKIVPAKPATGKSA